MANEKTENFHRVQEYIEENHPDLLQAIEEAGREACYLLRSSGYPDREVLKEYDGEDGTPIDLYLEGLALGLIYGCGLSKSLHFGGCCYDQPGLDDMKMFLAVYIIEL